MHWIWQLKHPDWLNRLKKPQLYSVYKKFTDNNTECEKVENYIKAK